MLPLAGTLIPDSPEALSAALQGGLTARGIATKEATVQGLWPELALLRLDLTGAQLLHAQRPSPLGELREDGFTAARFELVATPAQLQSAQVLVSLHADQAAFGFAQAADGALSLTIQRATRGELTIEMACAALESLVHSLASAAAREHGVDIKSTKVRFVSRGPRAVSITAEVTAKMFIATATVTLSGDVDLDEQLNAQLSHLRFSGDGMVANLAGGFIRPHFAALEGRNFPLVTFVLGEIRLRDVQLEAGDALRLTARFGS
jgi:hypothetical protein